MKRLFQRAWLLGITTIVAFVANTALLVGPSALRDVFSGEQAIASSAAEPSLATAPSAAAPSAAVTAGGTKGAPTAPMTPSGQRPPAAAGAKNTGKTDTMAARDSAALAAAAKAQSRLRPVPVEPGEDADLEAPQSLDDLTADAAALERAEKGYRRIGLAYEAMEPQHAATAIAKLAGRDLGSAVRTLMAMNPRRAGAVLDARSVRWPDTAASLTSEMLAESSPAAFLPAR